MNRTTRVALIVSALTALCVVGACVTVLSLGSGAAVLLGCPDPDRPAIGSVIDRPQRVEQLFPQLAPVDVAHWQEREAVPRTCPQVGPMDYVMSGFVVLAPARVEQLGADWLPAAAPDVPEALRPHAPAAPQWTGSARFDAEAGARFLLDRPSRTLFFTRTTT